MEFLVNFCNETLLHFACNSGNIDLVKYLISLNQIDIKSTTVFSLIFFFMKFLLIFLIQFYDYFFLWNFKIVKIFETILHFACKSDNLELVKYIISLNEIDVDAKDILKFIFLNKVLTKKIYEI